MSEQDVQAADPLINTLIAGRYRVIKRLGEGGMGEVYLGMHEAIEKKVALKVLRPEYSTKADIVTRFQQEAISASRIKHPNVLEIFDFGQLDSGAFYLAMEFLEGHDLADELQRVQAMPAHDAIRISLQICRALSAAHGKGVVHRDMKPENVFLLRVADGEEIVKIVDFGIAQLRSNESPESQEPKRRRLTKTGMIFGTPEYMSPEQAAGKKADERVDIYATGIIMYEMLTGAVPFTGETFMAVLASHLNDEPPPMRAIVPDLAISPELEAVITRSLAKKPDERFQTMNELALAILATPEGAGVGPATRQLSFSDPSLSVALPGGYQPSLNPGAVTNHQFGAGAPGQASQTAAQFGGRGELDKATAVSVGTPTQTSGSPAGVGATVSIPVTSGQNPDQLARAHTHLESSTTQPPEEKPRSKAGLLVGGLLGLGAIAAGAAFFLKGGPVEPSPELPGSAAANTAQAPAADPTPSVVASQGPPPVVEPEKPRKFTLKVNTNPEGAVVKKGEFQVCPSTPCEIVADPDEALELSATKGAMRGTEKVLAQQDGQNVLIQLIAPARPQPQGPKLCETEVDGLKILRPCK